MIIHNVKVFPSKVHLPKKKQLAWKIAEIASDNAKLDKEAIINECMRRVKELIDYELRP